MTTKKQQPTPQPAPEQRDDLTLDAQTVVDLEPGTQAAAQVAGGGRFTGGAGCVLGGGAPVGTSDARLKQDIEPLPNALARLRGLGLQEGNQS